MDPREVLTELRATLQAGSCARIVGRRPGSGASALALEYAYAFADSYQAVWWIDADSSVSAYLGALQFLKALDIVEGRGDGDFHGLHKVKERLSDHGGWLVILDNVSDAAIVDTLIPDDPMGDVIYVNPGEDVVPAAGGVEVSELEHDASVALLEPAEEEKDAAAELARMLHHSPLLLHLVRRYHAVSERSYGEILEDLPPYLLNQEEQHLEISLRLILSLALEYLSGVNKTSRDMLALCSFFGPYHVPAPIFPAAVQRLSPRLAEAVATDEAFTNVMKPLEDLGLISRDENAIVMHAAVQAAIREGMNEKPCAAWCNAAVNILSESFPQESRYREPNSMCVRLIPHVLQAGRFAEQLNVAPGTVSSLYYQAGLYLHSCRLLPEAADLYMRSIALVEEHFGTVHPAVATRINNLGIVEHDLGHLDSAQACFERAMDICERLYGPTEQAMYTQVPEEMLTLPLRNLCTVLEDKGDVALAQKEYERAMKTFVDVYGWNHSMVAECAFYFGNTWLKIGQLNKAQNCYIKAVRSEENAADCNNESLANYLNSLGAVLMRQKNFRLAEEQLMRALRLDRQALGNDHMSVSRDSVNLGHLYKRLDRYEDAQEHYNEALRILEIHGKVNTMDAALVLNNLGSVLLGSRHAAEARTCLEQALAIIAEEKGADSSSNISVLTNLGRALDRLEAYHQALNSYESAEKIMETQEDVSLVEKATLLYRKGLTHQGMGEFDEALALFERAQNIDTETFGSRHPIVARDAYCIGCVLKEKDETIVAMGHLSLALDIYETEYGKDHPKAAMVRRKLDEISNQR